MAFDPNTLSAILEQLGEAAPAMQFLAALLSLVATSTTVARRITRGFRDRRRITKEGGKESAAKKGASSHSHDDETI